MSDFRIGPAERMNPLWLRLNEHLNERLEQLRSQLEGDKNIDETNRLRGRIREVKALLDTAKDQPVIQTPIED